MANVRQGTPVRLAAEAHADLQRESLRLGADIGRRVSMSETVRSALAVAAKHRGEWLAELTPEPEDGTQ